MLGKLARWLRITGQDVELASKELSDREVKEKSDLENREILTRDKELAKENSNAYFIPKELEEQLRFLSQEFDIELEIKPKRCSKCNGKLIKTTSGLPEDVEKGWKCVECGQRYWKGSHWEKIKKVFEKASS